MMIGAFGGPPVAMGRNASAVRIAGLFGSIAAKVPRAIGVPDASRAAGVMAL
jgi:hypothetical protein